ncbi:MAG: CoA-binding protein [Candidatus Sumerlaeota bacterium]
MNVAVVGASPKPQRYSYRAIVRLQEGGHKVFAVTPKQLDDIEGAEVFASITDIPEDIHTATLYLSAKNSDTIADEIMKAKPQRIIFNPGAENPALAERAQEENIETLEACTLVMLSTGQF